MKVSPAQLHSKGQFCDLNIVSIFKTTERDVVIVGMCIGEKVRAKKPRGTVPDNCVCQCQLPHNMTHLNKNIPYPFI